MAEPAGRMERIEHVAAGWLVRRATPLFWGALLLSLVCIAGFSQLRLRNDYRAFFDAGDPVLERTDWLSRRLGDGRETAILIYLPQGGDALGSLAVLQYAEVADRARSLPYVTKAKSWYDAGKIVDLPGRDEAGLPRRALVPMAEGADLFSADGLRQLDRDMRATPTVSGRYVARDRSSATVVIQLDLESRPGSRLAKLRALTAAVEALEADLQRAAKGDRLILVGSTLFDYASTEVLGRDVRRLFPVALLIIVATLLLLYRSAAFTAAGLFVIVLPVAATGGLIATLGFEFSTLAISALLLVGTLAVADVLHVANSFFLLSETELDAPTALRAALAKNFWAITATSSTTAIGEIALLFSAAPPVRVMGYTVIVGVLVAWLLAVTMLPFVLLRIRTARRTGAGAMSEGLARTSTFCARHPWPVLVGFAMLLAVSTYGASLSRIDDSMSAWFSKNTEFRQGMDIIDANYLGLRTMTLAVRVADADRGIADAPAAAAPVKRDYARLQDALSAGAAGRWLSVVTAAHDRARLLRSPLPTGLRLDPSSLSPDPPPVTSRALSDAGLMTQYEPGRTDYTVWYFDPRGTTTFETLAAADRVAAAATMAAPAREPQLQGISLAFASLSARNFWSIVGGSVAAFAIMTVSLIVVFGSWRLGLLSMIPNLAPLLMIYGLWGFIDGRINMAAVSVFSVACGIVVDDTIHLVLTYQRSRRQGLDVEPAIARALKGSGTGVLATTVVVASGFFLLGLSDFSLTAQKATMVGAAIAAAFFFDLLAMPALLAVADQKGRGVAATA